MKNHVVLHEPELVFFCIPKVANSSIKAAILEALGHGHEVKHGLVPHEHRALNLATPEEVATKYFSFMKLAIVRNPWARLVSCYDQKICTDRVEKQGFTRIGFRRNMPFNDFIRLVCQRPSANKHFSFQIKELVFHGAYLPNFTGRIENLAADWKKIQKLALPFNLGALPHYNSSGSHQGRKSYRPRYDMQARLMVEDTYWEDIETFKYRF